jgi:hypothetical protein
VIVTVRGRRRSPGTFLNFDRKAEDWGKVKEMLELGVKRGK